MTTVTVITGSIGRNSLLRCVESVAKQTYSTQHLIFADGPEAHLKVKEYTNGYKVDIINLPYSTGTERWNAHRQYAAGTFLSESEYIIYLDDDNFLEQSHVEECLKIIKSGNYGWVYSLRNIVDKDGNFITRDDCESLGPKYETVLGNGDTLTDVNCFFIHKTLAVYVAPIWYRKAREPGVMEVDRALVKELAKFPSTGTGKYTVNYAVDGNQHSVSSGFFITGNEIMKKRYPDGFPWRK